MTQSISCAVPDVQVLFGVILCYLLAPTYYVYSIAIESFLDIGSLILASPQFT